MIKVAGIYYDGKTSQHTAVEMCFYPSGIVTITGAELTINTSMKQLSIASRLGNTRRNIYLPDGAKLETDDNDAIDQVCSYFDKNILQTLIHGWEKNWRTAFLSLLIAAAFIWGGIEYGVPVAAKIAAKGLSINYEEDIGEEGLETLDKWLFSASKLEAEKQQHIKQLFHQTVIQLNDKYHYRLKLRSSEMMGPNALALPGGLILMTDDFIELAENDQQIIAVLAHEIGHVEHQHGIRALFQSSLSAILMAAILGDVNSIAALSATLPTMLVESKYSRQFELEADQFAVDFFHQRNMDIHEFVKILDLLSQQHGGDDEFDYLSSHPAMETRVNIIQKKYH